MKYVFALIALLVLSACGKTEPLSAEQKTTLKDTNISVNRSFKAAYNAQQTRKTTDEVEAVQSTNIESQMYQHLLKYKNCKMDYKSTQSSSTKPNWFNPSESELNFNFAGECPVDFSLYLKSKLSYDSYKVEGKWFYLVKDEEYKKYNDITGIDISGNAELVVTDYTWSGSKKVPTAASGNANVSGSLLSNKYSKIDFDLQYEGKNISGEGSITQKLTLKYPDFKAEIKQVSTISKGVTTVEYFLNEEKITQSEYKEYFGYNFATKSFLNSLKK